MEYPTWICLTIPNNAVFFPISALFLAYSAPGIDKAAETGQAVKLPLSADPVLKAQKTGVPAL